MQGEGDAVECSPNDEIPGGTVPESSEKHGDEQVSVGLEFA